VTAAAAAAFTVLLVLRARRRLPLLALAVALLALLSGPAAYAFQTASHAETGSLVSAGPTAAPGGGGAGPGPGTLAPGGRPPPGPAGRAMSGAVRPGGGPAGGQMGGQTSQAVLDYLTSHQGGATWIVATSGAQSAAPIELATGKPVMAMGGFTGSDPAPTLAQLQSLIASGQLKYVLVGGARAGGPVGRGAASDVTGWVTKNCGPVSSTSGLYACTPASAR
jgi:hypothetical protein